MKELIALLNEIKPQYGAVGSRDVDVTAQRKRIDDAIAMLYEQAAKNPVAYRNKFTGQFFTLEQQPNATTDTAVYEPVFLAAPVLPKQPEPENKIAHIKRQKALAWLKRVAYENPHMKEVKTCLEVLSAPAQPVIPEMTYIMATDRGIKTSNRDQWIKGYNAAIKDGVIPSPAQQNQPQNIPENIPAQPVSEPYKFPHDWIERQFAYQNLFNAIAAVVSKHPNIEISIKAFEDSMLAAAPAQNGKSASTELPNHSNLSTNSPVIPDGWKLVPNAIAAVVSKHPNIEISIKAFEDSMLAAAPAQNGKSASTELPNHSNLSTNSPVIPDGWKLVPLEPTAAMFHAFNDCDYGRKSMRERYIQMIEAAPAREHE